MQYRFTPDQDWSDLSSGRVLRGRPGQTAFPARLASEIFRTCVAFCEQKGHPGPYAIYDPCCGAASLLTQVALLNPERISQVAGSDIDPTVLETAQSNFALLSVNGVREQCRKIEEDLEAFGKESHRLALQSAQRLLTQVIRDRNSRSLLTSVFQRDATSLLIDNIEKAGRPDIVLADIPYGRQSQWVFSNAEGKQAIYLLLESLLLLPTAPLVAIAAGKSDRVEHPSYQRLKRFSAGKRQIVFLSTRSSA